MRVSGPAPQRQELLHRNGIRAADHPRSPPEPHFFGGYATHGYFQVPAFAASHGCLRVPIADARRLFDWIRLGTPVDVYR